MSKREKIQEYVLIPKRKLNALEKKGHFDPDLDTSVLELVDELPKQYKMKAKSLTKWILTDADKTLYLDKNNLLHINGQTGDHLIDYVRYVTSPLKIKQEPSCLTLTCPKSLFLGFSNHPSSANGLLKGFA